jgi:glycerophosphoryl diester phosphodiesterase
MATVASLRRPPLGFAHRGARAHAPENTIDAFVLALRLGATGLESDVWITADGVPVLDHDGVVGRIRRRRIGDLPRAALPAHVLSLQELLERVGPAVPLSLDVKDPEAFETVVGVAEDVGAVEQLFLCHHDWNVVASWRSRSDGLVLVDSTRLHRLERGPERRAMDLRNAGIDCINLHESDWTAGLTTLFHRFSIQCFGWDAQLPRVLEQLLAKGVDGVYSDHVDRMVDAIAALDGPEGTVS